jgi:hypothetical protein
VVYEHIEGLDKERDHDQDDGKSDAGDMLSRSNSPSRMNDHSSADLSLESGGGIDRASSLMTSSSSVTSSPSSSEVLTTGLGKIEMLGSLPGKKEEGEEGQKKRHQQESSAVVAFDLKADGSKPLLSKTATAAAASHHNKVSIG